MKKRYLLLAGIFSVLLIGILVVYGKQYIQELLSARNKQEKAVEELALLADTVSLTYTKDTGEVLLYNATQTQIEDGTGILYAVSPLLTYQLSNKRTSFEITSSFGSFDQKNKLMLFSDNVQIESEDVVIYSTEAQLFIDKDLLVFNEGALVERENSSLKAVTLEWNLKTNALNGTKLHILYNKKKNKGK